MLYHRSPAPRPSDVSKLLSLDWLSWVSCVVPCICGVVVGISLYKSVQFWLDIYYSALFLPGCFVGFFFLRKGKSLSKCLTGLKVDWYKALSKIILSFSETPVMQGIATFFSHLPLSALGCFKILVKAQFG